MTVDPRVNCRDNKATPRKVVSTLPTAIYHFISTEDMSSLLTELKVMARLRFPVLNATADTLKDGLELVEKMYSGKTQYHSYVYGSAAVRCFDMIARTCTGMLQYRLEFPAKLSDMEYRKIVAMVQELEVAGWYFTFQCHRYINEIIPAIMCLEYTAKSMARQYKCTPKYVYFLANYLDVLCETPVHYRRIEKMRIELERTITETQALPQNYTKIPDHLLPVLTNLMDRAKVKYVEMREEFDRQKRIAEAVKAQEKERDNDDKPYNPYKLGKRSYAHLF